jgi:hypothetical protein
MCIGPESVIPPIVLVVVLVLDFVGRRGECTDCRRPPVPDPLDAGDASIVKTKFKDRKIENEDDDEEDWEGTYIALKETSLRNVTQTVVQQALIAIRAPSAAYQASYLIRGEFVKAMHC